MQRATWLDLTRSALLCYFYPRSRGFGCLGGGISIHALLAESDNRVRLSPLGPKYFYPRSPCGERHELSERRWRPSGISIHALLAESDLGVVAAKSKAQEFLSTLSLRRATCRLCCAGTSLRFLSTLSLRRATGDFLMQPYLNIFLSTLSLRRATEFVFSFDTSALISIHALLAESDRCTRCRRSADTDFYPRSPCGERLRLFVLGLLLSYISIHALLAESDPRGKAPSKARYNFYPRSPCGERRCISRSTPVQAAFLSTLSLRRATFWRFCRHTNRRISIHALLAESDVSSRKLPSSRRRFLSTLSLRRAT